ncbi:MAG: PEP-CTERM sorting domain-containing protein [Desulfobacteraceae bacterium]|nr:PEP-CTERM sorting domain-containing protein [Desulfobacteraceae bacterium]
MSNGTKIPEDEWIQNYATQLEARGGGLVLGTDHNAFQSGINRINELINISLFHGNYYTAPLVATVDPLSPLYVSGFPVINDNSSTGFVATGIQANGQTLTPVAYHGETSTAWDWAAVSSTMGSATFGTEVPEPATMMLFGLGLLGVAGIGRRKK